MKLLLVGDCHFRTKTPEHRTEPDFASVCLGKLKQVLRGKVILFIGYA